VKACGTNRDVFLVVSATLLNRPDSNLERQQGVPSSFHPTPVRVAHHHLQTVVRAHIYLRKAKREGERARRRCCCWMAAAAV